MADSSEPAPLYQLRWGIHRRFLEYVQALPDGRCTLGDGADVTENSDFTFALGQFSGIPRLSNDVDIRFYGSVRFSGHSGMLFFEVDQPRVTLHGDRALVSVTDFRLSLGPASRVTLATADVRPDDQRADVWHGDNVVLTSEGADLFLGTYGEGEPLADFEFALPPVPRVQH